MTIVIEWNRSSSYRRMSNDHDHEEMIEVAQLIGPVFALYVRPVRIQQLLGSTRNLALSDGIQDVSLGNALRWTSASCPCHKHRR